MSKTKEVINPETNWEIKDRTYRLGSGATPLSWTIQTKHTRKKPLLYFDEVKAENREIRYATNQKSIFVDEQDGYSTLGSVVFLDGSLFVSRQQQPLQKLLSLYHPKAGELFYEFDPLAKERAALGVIEQEVDALLLVTELEPDHIEAILRAEYGTEAGSWEPKIQKRRAFALAKNYPKLFVELAKDEDIKLRGVATAAIEYKILKVTNGGRTILYKDQTVAQVAFESNPILTLVQFFKSKDGMDLLKSIEKKLS